MKNHFKECENQPESDYSDNSDDSNEVEYVETDSDSDNNATAIQQSA